VSTQEPGEITPTESSVHDVILEMLDADAGLDAAVEDAVLAALAEVVGRADGGDEDPVPPTCLTSISVVGFRGIGRQATLELYPAPGLTVVSGRNGSGKSSFAEALERALTPFVGHAQCQECPWGSEMIQRDGKEELSR